VQNGQALCQRPALFLQRTAVDDGFALSSQNVMA
jgi:hypothetical protein